MEKEFDYAGAVKELEEIAVKVEDPSVGIDGIDVYIKRAEGLIFVMLKKAWTRWMKDNKDRPHNNII